MKKANILFVTQEIVPYLKDSPMGLIGRHLPQGIQERGKEIRTFMPRYGCINERRNQLHEVIRLSGMNLIIDDTDHPLIIKVASIQSARMQIYFIDNEDYFQRKYTFWDKNNKFYVDNDERIIFYSRGVLETVKKLGWSPDIIHCHGWISALLPVYLKQSFKDNPIFTDAKVVLSLYNDHFEDPFHKDFPNKVKYEGITEKELKYFKKGNYVNLMKASIDYSDAVIIGHPDVHPELLAYLQTIDKPVLEYQEYQEQSGYIDVFNDFYDEILVREAVTTD